MDPLTIIAIIEALMKFAGDIPELIAAGETAISLIQPDAAPITPEQQVTIDAGLAAAHAALQAS